MRKDVEDEMKRVPPNQSTRASFDLNDSFCGFKVSTKGTVTIAMPMKGNMIKKILCSVSKEVAFDVDDAESRATLDWLCGPGIGPDTKDYALESHQLYHENIAFPWTYHHLHVVLATKAPPITGPTVVPSAVM